MSKSSAETVKWCRNIASVCQSIIIWQFRWMASLHQGESKCTNLATINLNLDSAYHESTLKTICNLLTTKDLMLDFAYHESRLKTICNPLKIMKIICYRQIHRLFHITHSMEFHHIRLIILWHRNERFSACFTTKTCMSWRSFLNILHGSCKYICLNVWISSHFGKLPSWTIWTHLDRCLYSQAIFIAIQFWI